MLKAVFRKKAAKRILIAAIIIVLIYVAYAVFFRKSNDNLKVERVTKGTIIQQVSETGMVKPAEEINLGFKTSGRISQINVKVGDKVEKDASLISLDKTPLNIQLSQAQASLAVAQAQYDKLIAGYSAEEIKISTDAKNAAQNNLSQDYNDALNGSDEAYLKIYNGYNAVGSIQNSYFSAGDQESIKILDSENKIGSALALIKPILDTAKNNPSNANIDAVVSKTINALNDTSDALKIARETCEQGIYYSKVSAADKTILDNQRSYIITILASVTDDQQAIFSDKIAWQKTEDELALKTAKPRQEDIDYYQAKINEAQSNVDSYQRQIFDATLKSPIAGIITKADKKIGETVQAADLPISLISLDPFEVKADIYEEDIVKIKLGNLVDIKIAAFPGDVLKGIVASIDPAEKVVDGVVYYEISIAFEQPGEDLPASATPKALQSGLPAEVSLQAMLAGLKPGMTADIVVKTMTKENVLIISKEAVSENGKATVKVYKAGKIEDREIKIGLEGEDNKVEVMSGLIEGEEVVIE